MGINEEKRFQLDNNDADTILRLKAATMYAEIGYTGVVACSTRKLYERDADRIVVEVNESLLWIQYKDRYEL